MFPDVPFHQQTWEYKVDPFEYQWRKIFTSSNVLSDVWWTLQEKKHIGQKEFLKSKISYDKGDQTKLSFEIKRNLITNSSEFYDLSYEYYNDCLRAGLVYRREFYNDSELESENALMFKITLIPFGNINAPSINK